MGLFLKKEKLLLKKILKFRFTLLSAFLVIGFIFCSYYCSTHVLAIITLIGIFSISLILLWDEFPFSSYQKKKKNKSLKPKEIKIPAGNYSLSGFSYPKNFIGEIKIKTSNGKIFVALDQKTLIDTDNNILNDPNHYITIKNNNVYVDLT